MYAIGAYYLALSFQENLNTPVAVARILRRELVHRLENGRVFQGNFGFHSPVLTETLTTARKLVAPITHVDIRRPFAGDEPARLPFFCGDFLQNLDIEIPLRHQFLQPAVFQLELPQSFDVHRLRAPNRLRQA